MEQRTDKIGKKVIKVSWFLERIKLDNPLARLTIKKKKTQIAYIRNETDDVTGDSIDI